MITRPFEELIRKLCEDVLAEPTPRALPGKIIDHVQATFPVQWATLWLTEQKGIGGGKRLKLAAAGGLATRLLTAENGEPAVYDFGEGLTGEIALKAKTHNITEYAQFKKHQHARKYDKIMYEKSRADLECRCVLGVPLLLKSSGEAGEPEKPEWRVIGVLKLENVQVSKTHPESHFTEGDVKIVEAYAAVIAVALEKAQMRADSVRIGASLLEVSKRLLAELGGLPRLDVIVQETASAISAEACSLWLRSGLELRLVAAHGYPNKLDIPPYTLEPKADDPEPVTPATAAEESNESVRYRRVGLTVFVAKTGRSLNLPTAEKIRTHFAWKGENDGRMWKKKQGEACYSLLAIPLTDNDTDDLLGVFKIENKKRTLFQLQSYFTREDEQLLTTLGNSISFALIISERIDRLSRLERLVGDVRILDKLDEALFFILTGLTHRDGLTYNRAMIFLVDEKDPNRLVFQFAIGQVEPEPWQAEMDRRKGEPPLNLDLMLQEFRADKEKYLHNQMMERWKGKVIDLRDTERSVIARHAAHLEPEPAQEPSTRKYLSGDLPSNDMLSGFTRGDFVLIPIKIEKKLSGIIYADNCFTGNRVNRFERGMLDLFAGMAGAIIQASAVPQKLQKERDDAWRTFSRPAAHRLGTEAHIIDSEAELYIRPELQRTPPGSAGLVPVRGRVIECSLLVIQQAVNRLRLAVKDYQQLAFEVEEPVDFDLCEVADETIRDTTLGLKGIKVSSNYPGSPLWVRAARRGTAYVLAELLINAWKETQTDERPEAGEEIHEARDVEGPPRELDRGPREKTQEMQVKIELRREDDNAVCVVSDNGRGVPPSLLKELFQKPNSGRKGGTGLGLVISRQILERSRGTIELLSEGKPPGCNGACFKITLPLDPSRDRDRSARGGKLAPNVLVVEDNSLLRAHLNKKLTEFGFVCELVKNEFEAIERLSHTLRVIVADINLQEAGGSRTGGIKLAERLAEMNRRIPIILVSADPWASLPPMDSDGFRKKQEALCIAAVIDRNSRAFYDELAKALRNATGSR